MKLQQKKQKENRIWQLDKNTKDNPILHYRYMKTTFYCPLCGTREKLDYPALKYESRLIIQLAKMVEILDEAEKKDELDSVDDKLNFRFIKDEFENEDELRAFLQGVLYEPYLDLDGFEEVIDNIVKQMYK